MRGLIAAALVCGGIAYHAADASACSCDPSPTVVPGDGRMGVPLNARVVVHSLAAAPGDAYTLVKASDNSEVPVDVTERTRRDGSQRVLILQPRSSLEPNSAYDVLADTSYGWSTESRFVTGDAVDDEAPAYDGLVDVRFETMREEDLGVFTSCTESESGWHARIDGALGSLPADAAYVEVELFRPSDTDTPVDWFGEFDRLGASSHTCGQRPPLLEPGEGWCARATAYDLAGNAAGGDRIACDDVVECAQMYDADDYAPVQPCVERAGGGCTSGGAPGAASLLVLLVAVWSLRRRPARTRA